MQADEKSIFKWVIRGMWAIIGTVMLAPFAKWGEEQLNLSIFSPVIDWVWSWVQSVGSWLARDISFPVWVVMLASLLIVLLMVPVAALVYARYEGGECSGDEAAHSLPLTDDQNRVFVVVGSAIQKGYQAEIDEIRQSSGLSRIATQNVLEHLTAVGLIRAVNGAYGRQYADLTPLGREYFLELEALGKA
ncbi:hypothetical protein PSH79_16630 [Pseudomonas sp. FP2196]|uniref:hypothetical protein n=1 Tax=Pseudomonas sp. FP2196 TaxID=2954086 RepID=UPI0027375E82|nr:hypothetical protein [Pseudomonas sp. FP2196]WLH33558.1 hypothetical protein PSH79_16630 [Pseudomonas sp. FP2196]